MKIIAAMMESGGYYARLRHVFERSAAAVMPGVKIEVLELGARAGTRQDAMADCFVAAAERAIEAGGEVAVCDLDLMFLREIESVFAQPFDVAYTVRDTLLRYNTGLWFMRPSGCGFVERWIGWTRKIQASPKSYRAELLTFGGIDQVALFYSIGGQVIGSQYWSDLLELPCREWNATQSEWAAVDGSTRVVHVKSALRRAALGMERLGDPSLAPLVERFQRWEAA